MLGVPIQRRLTRVAGRYYQKVIESSSPELISSHSNSLLLLLISKAKHVVWYCGQFLFCGPKEENIILFSLYLGPPGGRGMRAASWFVGYIVEQGETSMKSLTLEGGIKGWAMAGSEHTELMSVMYQCGRSSCLEN